MHLGMVTGVVLQPDSQACLLVAQLPDSTSAELRGEIPVELVHLPPPGKLPEDSNIPFLDFTWDHNSPVYNQF